jgi:uncharacterized protein
MKAMSRTICLAALLCLSSAGMAADPAADCKTAKLRSIERLMCGSPMLQRLDQELARLYASSTAPKAGAAAPAIRKQQTAWVAQRADCVKSKTQAQCVRDVSLARIAAIRAQSKPARSADDKGISLGPFAFQCDGVQAPLDITFVNTDPGLAWVTIKDRSYPLIQQRSGSGDHASRDANEHLHVEAS